VFASLLLVSASGIRAQQTDRQRKSLQGLRVIALQVEDINSGAKALGLDVAALEADVKQQVTAAGLKLDPEVLECLRVRLDARAISASIEGSGIIMLGFATHAQIMLWQPVYLLRDPAPSRSPISTDGITWMQSAFVVGRSDFVKSTQKVARDLVEVFVSQYRAANPK
jgi:hypothetical protein